MSTGDLDALKALTFDWTSGLKDVWLPSRYHIEGLHTEAAELIRRGISEARASNGPNPLGIAIQGEGGVGKTHLLGWAREQVQEADGYFFLVGDLSRTTFWEEVLSSIVQQLLPIQEGKRYQLETLLADLASRMDLEKTACDAVTGQMVPTRDDLNAFITGLRRIDPAISMLCQDTARALVLLASSRQDQWEVGSCFLSCDELDTEERRAWGIRSLRRHPKQLIAELSRLLALSGPSLLAIDQIDALIDRMHRASEGATADRHLVAEVAGGLMTLRDTAHRTLTVIACLPDTWMYVRDNAVSTVRDRFRMARQLQNIPSADIGRLMIEKRFAVDFDNAGFRPRYPTWPIRPTAFEDARRYTARELLQRIESHVRGCLRDQTVRELDQLDEEAYRDDSEQQTAVPGGQPTADRHDLAALDARFAELRGSANVSEVFDPATEDLAIPPLLRAGLESWIRERGDANDGPFFLERPLRKDPPLHACLRMMVDARTERQRRWSFRAIAADHARSVQSRLRKAMTEARLDGESPDRRLFLLRNTAWPNGAATKKITAELADKGGVAVTFTAEDIRTFDALSKMLDSSYPDLDTWLAVRRPAHDTELFRRALGDVAEPAPAPEPEPQPRLDSPPQSTAQPMDPAAIRIGTTTVGQAPTNVDLKSLRKHIAIIAGSGSGKTVLLRRVVEECALRGVSGIVLDPGGDLSRLGDAWPEPPESWAEGDAERARDYLVNTDVVVWTPRVPRGRPLTFQPLPVFTDLRDDPGELDAAVSAAIEALAPRAKVTGTTAKAEQEKAVLTSALWHFARAGSGGLSDFIVMLSDLPEEAWTLSKSSAIAAELAERLKAARINDPLFGGFGQSAEPGVLLTPSPGKRARISVISMIGLRGLEQRQSFVNQLQMALFSWINKHPASDGQLGGLFVMDEAQDLVPSRGVTVCTESTIRLAAQARKYGLGLLFATQSPTGVHNQIPGNATTQFYGLLSHPTQIDRARDLARAKGGDVPDIGRLTAGQFYLGAEGRKFQKIRTPMCLSHHASPLTEDEIIARANRS
jgi:hypothetical protein